MQRTPKDQHHPGDPAPTHKDDKEKERIRRLPDSEKNPFGPDRRSGEDDSDPSIGSGGTGGRDW